MGLIVLSAAPAPQTAVDISLRMSEVYEIGSEQDDVQFAQVRGMGYAASGELVVFDDDYVVVLGAEGRLVHRWGGRGEGPQEFSVPTALAVSRSTGILAISDGNRIKSFELDGNPTGAGHSLPPGTQAVILGFGTAGDLGALTLDFRGSAQLIRLPDGAVLRRYDSAPGLDGLVFQLFKARPAMAVSSDGKVFVTRGDEYVISVIDLSTGEAVGEVVRDVSVREVPQAFGERVRGYLGDPASAPPGWESIVGFSNQGLPVAITERMTFSSHFPVIGGMFVGGGVLWVRRGVGVGDDLALPIEPPVVSHAFDLFDTVNYRYMGTVVMDDGFVPVTLNDSYIAGFRKNSLDVPSVVVKRWEANTPPSPTSSSR